MTLGMQIELAAERERTRIAEADAAALAEAARDVMAYLEQHGPSIVPHLLDTDENPGERLREALRQYDQREVANAD